MSAPKATAAELDPFALPTETMGRFRMLITAAVVLVWGVAALLVPGRVLTDRDLELPVGDRELAWKALEGGFESLSSGALESVLESEGGKRSAEVLGKWFARMAVSVVLVTAAIACAWSLYRTHPRWRGLSRRVQPLTPEQAAGPVHELRRLIETTGLSSGISLGHLPGPSFDGLVFGPAGRETLVLQCPPDLLGPAWDGMMRPVAYHELGHIANGDVRNQEASFALWVVVGGLFLALTAGTVVLELRGAGSQGPGLTGPGDGSATGTPLGVLARSVVSVGIVWWIWAGLLRVREHYADWRAVAWGQKEALLRRLGLPESRPGRTKMRRAVERLLRGRSRLSGVFEVLRQYGLYHHPSNARRIRVIEDPRTLFRVSADLAFATGLLLTTILAHAELMASDAVLLARAVGTMLAFLLGPVGTLGAAGVGLMGVAILAYLVTGALGIQVQRQAVADLATGPRRDWGYLRLGKTAVWFSLGLETGLLLTPARLLSAPVPIPYALAWLGVFIALTWLWLLYVHAMSRFLLGSATGPEAPRRRQSWLSWISAGLLAVLYSPALAARVSLHRAGDLTQAGAVPSIGGDPVETFVFQFVLTSIVLLGGALAIYILLGVVSTVAATLRLVPGRPACPTCRQPDVPRLAVGRRCEACGAPLAPWLLVRPAAAPSVGGPP